MPSGASEGLALTLAFLQGVQTYRPAENDATGESSASHPNPTGSHACDGNMSRRHGGFQPPCPEELRRGTMLPAGGVLFVGEKGSIVQLSVL